MELVMLFMGMAIGFLLSIMAVNLVEEDEEEYEND